MAAVAHMKGDGMSLPSQLSDTDQALVSGYDAHGKTLPGADHDWLARRRANAMALVGERGLPHRRVEEWKYTDLKAKLKGALGYAAPDLGEGDVSLGADPFAGIEGHHIVFVNGVFRSDLSDVSGLMPEAMAKPLSEVMTENPDWLVEYFGDVPEGAAAAPQALNMAAARDGVCIYVEAGKRVGKPIRLIHVTTAAAGGHVVPLRHLVLLCEGARAEIIESHFGADAEERIVSQVSEIHLQDRAVLHHIRSQQDGAGSVHLGAINVQVGEGARYTTVALTTGGDLTRNEVMTRFTGGDGYVSVSGAAMLMGAQHCDNTTVIDHAVADCESHELFKNVIADKARGVFQGKIIVARDAQRTDGYQLSQGLLLSPTAEVDTKPELEIYADDVKCSHGATIGALDDDAIFYLRTRGIPLGEAKSLLVGAFVGDVLEQIDNESVREALTAHVHSWLDTNKDRVANAISGPRALENGDD